MSWSNYGWRPYVPVAQRKAKAARELKKMSGKGGAVPSPVTLEGRTIASTFWGKAWCDNLEAYSDFSNRLPRGRTYVRNGSVVDLKVSPGLVSARVCGSSLYRIQIKIKPLPAQVWKSIQTECAGKIDSLLELLQGKLSSGVMQVVTRQQGGLFPSPSEISLDCSCPDWAELCKHVAASLYGVGARLDLQPELLFVLRGVDPQDLITKASSANAIRQTGRGVTPAMTDAEVADVFGIELETGLPARPTTKPALSAAPSKTLLPASQRSNGASNRTAQSQPRKPGPARALPAPAKPAAKRTREKTKAPIAVISGQIAPKRKGRVSTALG